MMRRRSRSILFVTAGVIVLAASAAAMTNSKLAPSALRGIAPTAQTPAAVKKTAAVAPQERSHKHVAGRRSPKRIAHALPGHSISVPMDEVRVVQFSQPVSTVYVGNPMIADVNSIDERHAFILGKAFGETNIIALDGTGKQIVNDHVSVFGHTGGTVTLNRGVAQVTYSCASAHCEMVPTPGDEVTSFKNGMSELTVHRDESLKSALGKTASSEGSQ